MTVCPYCNIEVRESAIEAEDGCCPECGALLGTSDSLIGGRDDEYEDDEERDDDVFDEFDEDDEDDDYEDEDDSEYYELECPSCGEVVCFDDSLDPENLVCPACGEAVDTVETDEE